MADTDSESSSGPIDSIVAVLKERVRSPFFGAVVVAWILINWRALLFLLLDEGPILERIAFVDQEYMTTWKVTILPLLSGVIYVTVSPWLSAVLRVYRSSPDGVVDKNALRTAKELADAKREIDDPGGLNRTLEQLKEDLARREEFIKQADEQLAETKKRFDSLNSDISARITSSEKELERTRDAKAQLEIDVQKLSSSKTTIHSEIAALAEQKEKLRISRVEFLDKPLSEAKVEALTSFVSSLKRHGMDVPTAIRFIREQGVPPGLLPEVNTAIQRSPLFHSKARIQTLPGTAITDPPVSTPISRKPGEA